MASARNVRAAPTSGTTRVQRHQRRAGIVIGDPGCRRQRVRALRDDVAVDRRRDVRGDDRIAPRISRGAASQHDRDCGGAGPDFRRRHLEQERRASRLEAVGLQFHGRDRRHGGDDGANAIGPRRGIDRCGVGAREGQPDRPAGRGSDACGDVARIGGINHEPSGRWQIPGPRGRAAGDVENETRQSSAAPPAPVAVRSEPEDGQQRRANQARSHASASGSSHRGPNSAPASTSRKRVRKPDSR